MYKEVYGIPSEEHVGTPPTQAHDLEHSGFSLRMRMRNLDSLAKCSNGLAQIDKILSGVSNSGLTETWLKNALKYFEILKTKIEIYNLYVPCESCIFGSYIPIHGSFCRKCIAEGGERGHESTDGGIIDDRMILQQSFRNLKMRIDYLTERLSCSLSNQLSYDELNSIIHESNILCPIMEITFQRLGF